MKVWITKHALEPGRGILHLEKTGLSYGKVLVAFPGQAWARSYFPGSEAHETQEAAIAKAEQMRLKKIEQLKKQIARLESLRFDEVEP